MSKKKHFLTAPLDENYHVDFSKMPGYHLKEITKGEFGESTKILEEAHEFADAITQDCAIMAILELADLYGAMQGYLARHHPSLTMDDLKRMSEITQRAFRNGHR